MLDLLGLPPSLLIVFVPPLLIWAWASAISHLAAAAVRLRIAVDDPQSVSTDHEDEVPDVQHWLGYRYPHYDEMERAATGTLAEGGLATVRVGFDPTTGTDAEWHVALYTPRHATPDAGTTRAAAEEWNPAGMLLHHVLFDGTAGDARGPEHPRPQQVVRLLAAAFEAGIAEGMVLRDGRAPQRAHEASAARRSAAEQTARTVVEAAIVDGLRLRCGFLLVPTMVVIPEMLADLGRLPGRSGRQSPLDPASTMAWSPQGVAVCRYCTTVFVPRTGGHADRCRLCRKRPAEPRVIGQCFPSPSEPVTVRARGSLGTSFSAGGRSRPRCVRAAASLSPAAAMREAAPAARTGCGKSVTASRPSAAPLTSSDFIVDADCQRTRRP